MISKNTCFSIPFQPTSHFDYWNKWFLYPAWSVKNLSARSFCVILIAVTRFAEVLFGKPRSVSYVPQHRNCQGFHIHKTAIIIQLVICFAKGGFRLFSICILLSKTFWQEKFRFFLSSLFHLIIRKRIKILLFMRAIFIELKTGIFHCIYLSEVFELEFWI